MEQGSPSNSDLLADSPTKVNAGSQPDHAHSSKEVQQQNPRDRLALLQQAFLLGQLAMEEGGGKSIGELNEKITAAAKRELGLSKETANRVRRELAEQTYLETTKNGRKISYSLTDAGRAYMVGLERPALSGRAKQPAPVDEAAIPDEVREAQKAYLLLQLLDADGQSLTQAEANKIGEKLRNSLGLKPAVANYRRFKLTDQGYIRITPAGRANNYTLTPDGLDYLAAGAKHLEHAHFTLKGKTLNALVLAARESSFERSGEAGPPAAERTMPGQTELAEAVLAEFQELRRERHGSSGLVPIHEVRQRIVERFGPIAGGHEILDKVILGLWRQQRLSLEAISDLSDANEKQLNESIQGVNGTLFYLEAPREQFLASESLQR